MISLWLSVPYSVLFNVNSQYDSGLILQKEMQDSSFLANQHIQRSPRTVLLEETSFIIVLKNKQTTDKNPGYYTII